MAIPSEATMQEMFKCGMGVQVMTSAMMTHVPLSEFLYMPEPGERNPWPDRVHFPWEPYDDGGGAALAAYRYGRCAFATNRA